MGLWVRRLDGRSKRNAKVNRIRSELIVCLVNLSMKGQCIFASGRKAQGRGVQEPTLRNEWDDTLATSWRAREHGIGDTR